MATNVQQAQLRGRYQQIIDHDRGRLMHLRRMTQIILHWQIHLALNIQHPRSIVANLLQCVLEGVESWQRGATMKGKVP